MTAVVIHPGSPNILYISTSGNGVFKSGDGGASWSSFNEGLTNLEVRVLAKAPDDPITLYAGTSGGVFRTGGVFRIIDDTPTLTLESKEYCIGKPWRLTLRNGAHNASVRLLGTSNARSWEIPIWHQTDASGAFTVEGTFEEGTEGSHTLRVEINGVSSNSVSFVVSNCSRSSRSADARAKAASLVSGDVWAPASLRIPEGITPLSVDPRSWLQGDVCFLCLPPGFPAVPPYLTHTCAALAQRAPMLAVTPPLHQTPGSSVPRPFGVQDEVGSLPLTVGSLKGVAVPPRFFIPDRANRFSGTGREGLPGSCVPLSDRAVPHNTRVPRRAPAPFARVSSGLHHHSQTGPPPSALFTGS
jgi:hypothetical protein